MKDAPREELRILAGIHVGDEDRTKGCRSHARKHESTAGKCRGLNRLVPGRIAVGTSYRAAEQSFWTDPCLPEPVI